MSSRKSRFKIVANIPVRRKQSSQNIVSEQAKENEEVVKTCQDDIKEELSKSKKEIFASTEEHDQQPADTDEILSAPQSEKPLLLKRFRPAVCLPLKKRGPRDDESETPESVVNEANFEEDTDLVTQVEGNFKEHIKNDKLSFEKDQNIVKDSLITPEERPVTPIPPTSPIKSPVKGRFTRPLNFDNTLRRPAVRVSSASESEDDSKRTPNFAVPARVRKASEGGITQLKSTNVPQNESDSDIFRLAMVTKRKKPKTSQFVRKIAEARRDFNKKFENKKPDRSSLKMFDLIFYNPSSNPISSPTPNASKSRTEKKSETSEMEKEIEEEIVDDPEPEDVSGENDEIQMPVPQVKIGANGEIILDEKSLTIETTEARKGREALMNSVPVFEDRNRKVSYYGKRNPKVKDWTPSETKLFYKALNSLGTDFALMQQLFPTRTRGELKNKFKREERLNGSLIDTVLGQPSRFDIKTLNETFEIERKRVEEETKRQLELKQRLIKEKKEAKLIKKVTTQLGDPLPHASDPVSVLEDFTKENQVDKSRSRRKRRCLRRKFSDYIEFDDDDQIELPKKKVKEVTVYYPVREHDSDVSNDTVCDSNDFDDSVSRTESISNTEFISLLSKNLKNFQQSTIRFQMPADDSNPNVKITLEGLPPDCDDGDLTLDSSLVEVLEQENNITTAHNVEESPEEQHLEIEDIGFIETENESLNLDHNYFTPECTDNGPSDLLTASDATSDTKEDVITHIASTDYSKYSNDSSLRTECVHETPLVVYSPTGQDGNLRSVSEVKRDESACENLAADELFGGYDNNQETETEQLSIEQEVEELNDDHWIQEFPFCRNTPQNVGNDNYNYSVIQQKEVNNGMYITNIPKLIGNSAFLQERQYHQYNRVIVIDQTYKSVPLSAFVRPEPKIGGDEGIVEHRYFLPAKVD